VQQQQVRLVQQERESLAQQAQQQQVRLEQRALVQKLFVQLSELVVFRPWALMLLALALMQRSKLQPLVDKI
jgi:hypothetical protein